MSVCLARSVWYSLPAAVDFCIDGSVGWTLMRGNFLISCMRSSTSANSSTSGRTTTRTASSSNRAISSSARAWVIRTPPHISW